MRATDLGHRLFGSDGLDPYLEDPATLWILHWQLATNLYRAATWYWTFNHFHEPEFSRDTLGAAVFRWSQTLSGKKVAESSVRRDVETFLRTYTPPRHAKGELAEETLDCPLVELGLIHVVSDAGHVYAFNRGAHENLPAGVLLYATLKFWEQFSPQAQSLALPDLARQPGGPGQVFKIDEASLVARNLITLNLPDDVTPEELEEMFAKSGGPPKGQWYKVPFSPQLMEQIAASHAGLGVVGANGDEREGE